MLCDAPVQRKGTLLSILSDQMLTLGWGGGKIHRNSSSALLASVSNSPFLEDKREEDGDLSAS